MPANVPENVIAHARDAFKDTIALQMEQLRRYVKKGSNSALTGAFVEQTVKAFLQQWIGHRLYLTGTFYSAAFAKSKENPKQIDGIVYDPTAGPAILHQGNFVVVHPAFCTSVIEVKTSEQNLNSFETALQDRWHLYLKDYLPQNHVMGIVIGDPDAKKASMMCDLDGKPFERHNHNAVNWCPIFILYTEKNDEYEPFDQAIDAMICAVYDRQIGLPRRF